MFICPDGPRNASENDFEDEIINQRFVVFHQNIRPTSYTGLSSNDRFNLWHGLVYFSKSIPTSLQLPVCHELHLNDVQTDVNGCRPIICNI